MTSYVDRGADRGRCRGAAGRSSGRVHDENAWALTGEGGSGHAGMFGTVGAVLAFG